MRASRENSTTAVFFHTFMAEQVGLGATESKTLYLLGARGPMTAGEIARETGLTTPSVTSLIDRLESKGFVRRVRDSHDRRRVIVEQRPERLAELNNLFGSLADEFGDIVDAYSDDQLAAIADYLTRSSERSREIVARLQKRKQDAPEAEGNR
ncbi:putative HTH-type transcriptional regulator YcgE [Ktedonospora formicarum]|uniref:Putative HTH-type transcriptional regulator YcgE n=2 Tax=Ktedonospora formicarum TaxID=2778364 RepID=A0A8J3I4P1_9CHLR|nr:putative HTH-type transcriptional regulator YcgE [Ktedonospora formicarum]